MSAVYSRFTYFSLVFLIALSSCRRSESKVVTVTGEIPASAMGITLPNEHVLFDVAPIDSTSIYRYNRDSVVNRILPFFDELKSHKVQTFVDGTPEFMGRDPLLLAELSRRTGINILTGTGWYSVDGGKHLPKEINDLTAEEIAQIWIGEAKSGIGNTGIKPGFINIALDKSELTENDKKLTAAACLTHLETGLPILSRTGPALGAMFQLKILEKYGVDPSAFIWSHAMEENSKNKVLAVAEKGAWVLLDGILPDMNAEVRISGMVQYLKLIRRLDHVLLSHDGSGYRPGVPNGGTIRPYNEIFGSFRLLLLSEGITPQELDQVMIQNPAAAFGVKVRKKAK